MEPQQRKWSAECLVCLACLAQEDGSGFDVFSSELGSGRPAIQLLAATTGLDAAAAASALFSSRLCSSCYTLLDHLDRAETEFHNIRAEFFRIVAANERLAAISLPAAPLALSVALPEHEPAAPLLCAVAVPFRPLEDQPEIKRDREELGVIDDDDGVRRDSDSDDEPLVKNKKPSKGSKRRDAPAYIQVEVPPLHPIASHDYSCRECGEGFDSKTDVANHALSAHDVNPIEDRAVIISNKGRKRKSKKLKTKHLDDGECDDEDWKMPKTTRGRRAKMSSRLLKSAGDDVRQPNRSGASGSTDSHFDGDVSSSTKADTNGESDDRSDSKKRAAKKEPKQLLTCSHCPATFSSQVRLDYHMVKHTGTKSPYICEICGASYKHKKACDIHVGMHKGISPWKCNECNKIFPSKGALSRHEAIHTGTPNYQCDLCGKSFIHTSSFKMHKLSHTGVKPHSCNKCGLALMTRSHLKRHQRVHSGEKRHECLICGKKFSERYNLYAHQKSHESVAGALQRHKNHDCTVCDATFNRRHILEKHMETMHQRVNEAAPRKQRNTMTKLLKQQARELASGIQPEPTPIAVTFEVEDVKISIPSPATTPVVQTNTDSTSSTLIGENFQQSSSGQVTTLKVEPNTAGSSQDGSSASTGPLPWQGIINYHLSNDYPFKMHGVDYAGYLNRQ